MRGSYDDDDDGDIDVIFSNFPWEPPVVHALKLSPSASNGQSLGIMMMMMILMRNYEDDDDPGLFRKVLPMMIGHMNIC